MSNSLRSLADISKSRTSTVSSMPFLETVFDLIKHLFIHNAESKQDTERVFLNNWLNSLERGLFF